MKKFRIILFAILLVFVTITTVMYTNILDSQKNQPVINAVKQQTIAPSPVTYTVEPPPLIKAKSISGEDIDLNLYKGGVVFVDFWATWCPPCVAEIPHFVNLQKKYKKKGFKIIGISVDKNISPVLKFMKDKKINYPIIMGTPEIIKKFGEIRSIPTTFILDKNLNIVEKVIGYKDEAFFENLIINLLK